MDQRNAYIVLNMIEGIGPVSVRRLIDALGSPRAILDADREALMQAKGVGEKIALKVVAQRDSLNAEEEIEKAAELGFRIITPLDAEYPEALKTIHDPPLALYVSGALEPKDKRSIAIVGSRATSH
ncbi:MAG: DNA-processing protein DprA, partial [Kiritimatiellales bacterium]|nr:DNA-processing protein DprA [Kiritimatiellales bacterium]